MQIIWVIKLFDNYRKVIYVTYRLYYLQIKICATFSAISGHIVLENLYNLSNKLYLIELR